MKACGVIVEYNPFHNGHAYHVAQARQLSGADVVIAVMSGNFLQRGEPAVIDKWQRAQLALQHGVDLVVELPVEWSVQSADYFAQGGVQLLQALGCDSICFGTDQQNDFDYDAFCQFMKTNVGLIDQQFQALDAQNMSYPQKMAQVLAEVYPLDASDLTQPNHILGLSYARANAQYEQPMRLLPIPRLAADFHSTTIDGEIASATAIRRALKDGANVEKAVPSATAAALTTATVVDWETYWPYLKYQLLTKSIVELQQIYQMVDGIEYRLKEQLRTATSFTDYLEKIKTKRYTYTRLQRLLCYVLLNVTKEAVAAQWQQPSLHILGFTEKGQAYLKQHRKSITLPTFAKIGKKEAEQCPLTIQVDDVYRLGHPTIQEQNFGCLPIRVVENQIKYFTEG